MNTNEAVARTLDEVAQLLEEQRANRFRAQAYRRAAQTLRHLARPVADLLAQEGTAGLEHLPGIGRGLAASIEGYVRNGHLPVLERLRGERNPINLLLTVPGVGPALARRLYEELGLKSLEDLELAAHDGRLENLAGLGPKRLAGIRDSLAHRLRAARPRAPAVPAEPPVAELLDVDAEYRARAAAEELKKIAPRRFNARGEAWLPVLHTRRNSRRYTALFSNTAQAHKLGMTHDWVVLYYQGSHGEERQSTAVTANRGPLTGKRVVRGREADCLEFYHQVGERALAA